MRYSFRWYFLRWLTYVAATAEGIVGVLTLGCVDWGVSLHAQSLFLDECGRLSFEVREAGVAVGAEDDPEEIGRAG